MADLISETLAKDDAAIAKLLGVDAKVKEFKDSLAEADKLSGDARKRVLNKLQRQLTPHVYPDELKWAVEEEGRKAAGKTTPCSVVRDCGCDVLGD